MTLAARDPGGERYSVTCRRTTVLLTVTTDPLENGADSRVHSRSIYQSATMVPRTRLR